MRLSILLVLVLLPLLWYSLPASAQDEFVVLGYNELGMHCMNQDFSQLMILPPYNTLHAQVIQRLDPRPQLTLSGVTVTFSIPGNTYSVGKTNFWTYAQALLGVKLPANIGLTGNGLSGSMVPTGENDWFVTGIPITPITDNHFEDPYQLATIVVSQAGVTKAQTQAVVPVSWEVNCDLCHNGVGEDSILFEHDDEHGTNLRNSTPVFCGKCHAQAPLGTTGQPSLSHAMHSSHADRIAPILPQLGGETCYACHPGIRTQCLRDVHYANGMGCEDCHVSMQAVGSETRRPWVDEPRCGDCHARDGFEFEQPNTLFRNSVGHGGVHCEACHGTPHAITPSTQPRDNIQAIALQGHAGPIDDCLVCHATQPTEPFWHRAQQHPLLVTATCSPTVIASGGTTNCNATVLDSLGHGIATWSWSDNGAGGSFIPSSSTQNPTYVARSNITGADRTVYLTVSARCDGSPAAVGTDTVDVVVHPSHRFADIPTDFWARLEIEACYAAGIVQGYADNTYRPSIVVSRAQMAAYIARAVAGGDSNIPAGPPTPTFTDVPTTHWAYTYVEYAASRHIVIGYTDGSYHPDESVNRAQMAVFIARSIVNPTGESGLTSYTQPTVNTFPDVLTSFWAYKHIEYCVSQGVVQGYPDGKYHAEYAVKRDQMAAFVARAFYLLE